MCCVLMFGCCLHTDVVLWWISMLERCDVLLVPFVHFLTAVSVVHSVKSCNLH